MKIITAILIALPLFLTACSGCSSTPVPVPPEKAAYIGEWKAGDMLFIITKEGVTQHGNPNSTSLVKMMTAPLRGFEGNNIEVGITPVLRTYEVSVPPHAEGKEIKMTMDKVEYTKIK